MNSNHNITPPDTFYRVSGARLDFDGPSHFLLFPEGALSVFGFTFTNCGKIGMPMRIKGIHTAFLLMNTEQMLRSSVPSLEN